MSKLIISTSSKRKLQITTHKSKHCKKVMASAKKKLKHSASLIRPHSKYITQKKLTELETSAKSSKEEYANYKDTCDKEASKLKDNVASLQKDIESYKDLLSKERKEADEKIKQLQIPKPKVNKNSISRLTTKINIPYMLQPIRKESVTSSENVEVVLKLQYDEEVNTQYEKLKSDMITINESDRKALKSIEDKSLQMQQKMEQQIAMYEAVIIKRESEKDELQKQCIMLEAKNKEIDTTNSKLASTLKNQLTTMKHLESANETLKEKVKISY